MNADWRMALVALLLPIGATGCGDELVDVRTDDSASEGGTVPPTAVAGADLLVPDFDLNGRESVLLDACASTAGSRAIVAYTWREIGTPLEGVSGAEGCTLTVDLAVGLHTITLTVSDDAGRSDEDRVRVDIRDPRPLLRIVTPVDRSGIAVGTEAVFHAEAMSWTGQPIEDGQLVWTSDLDGPLGAGSTISRADLSRGLHDITVAATDDDGLTAAESVEVFVGDPPVVTILAPEDGRACAVFDAMRLEGACVDSNGDPVTGSGVHWEPDMWMGTERRYDLSVDAVCGWPGPQTISLVCTDANGVTARAEATVEYFLSYRFNVQAVLDDFGCTGCHGPSAQEGGVRLDTYLALTTGGYKDEPLIVPGDSMRGVLIPKLVAAHHEPDWSTLTTPFDWESVFGPYMWEGIEVWWVERMLAPWIQAGALDN